MPTISSLILTGLSPVTSYTASVVLSGSVIADGLGNQITFLQVSSSYSHTSSIQTSWEESSSFASQSFSSSYAETASYAPGSPSISASYAETASFAMNGGGEGTLDILQIRSFI